MSKRVSILIPCHNAEQWVAQTLDSALSQTWREVEIIVVDDGSQDGSLGLLQSYENKGVKVIAQEQNGASHARNTAYKASTGSFVQFLDADDLLAPDKIERQMRLFSQLGEQASLVSGSWGVFGDEVSEAKFKPQEVWATLESVDWLTCSWEGGGMMHPAAWLLKRTLIEKAGLWNESLSLNDDGEFFTRMMLAAGKVFFCEDAKSFYRSGHSGRLSAARSDGAIQSAFDATTLCTDALLAVDDSPCARHACASLFQRFAYSIYPDGKELVKNAEARVAELGGTTLQIEAGPKFELIAACLGWKIAKYLQRG